MLLLSKTAYHSTINKGMKQFETTTNGDKARTGEGAMVHGWGLYLQADKELNITYYKNGFYKSVSADYMVTIVFGEMMDITNYVLNDKIYIDRACTSVSNSNDDYFGPYILAAVHNTDSNNNTHYSNMLREIEQFPDEELRKKSLQLAHDTQVRVEHLDGAERIPSQYTVEIPDDFVFLNEDKLEENETIKSIIKELGLPTSMEEYNEIKTETFNKIWDKYPSLSFASAFEEYGVSGKRACENELIDRNYYKDFNIDYDPEHKDVADDEMYKDIEDIIENYFRPLVELYDNLIINGKTFYKTLSIKLGSEEKASEYLYNHGINGIEYNGRVDGLCYVIFNCSRLKIIKEE